MNYLVILLLLCITIVASKYTCSKNDCYDCSENTCHLTCLGKGCSICPNGDCCNGKNCNVCISSICCSTSKCNECIISNRKTCRDEDISSIGCDQMIREKCGLNTLNDQPLETVNYAGILHNVTTRIKLRNVLNNTNLVDVPILLNLTQVNDVLLNKTGIGNVETGIGNVGYPGLVKPNMINRHRNCCLITHPQECHNVSQLPSQICFTRRHIECSDLCNNGTNLLIKAVTGGPSKCIVIGGHPYYYCGYYDVEDCSPCYKCKKENKLECLQDSECSNTCKSSIMPRKFYNVPYSIKNSNGSPPVE